jgi:isopenicillin N synthase-like dioxygenase
VIPLVALDGEAPARRIDAALRDAGFFAVTGHGVPQPLVDDAFAAARRFFGQDEATKQRYAGALDAPVRRGFDGIGLQALDPAQPQDLKEGFYVGAEWMAANVWPDAGFRAAVEAYGDALRALAGRLLALFETALGLPAGHFDAVTRRPMCTTRLLHYPPQPARAAPGQIGCGAHTDWGAITLLAQCDAGGLQVQRADGAWMDVAPIPDAFIVNIGDMTQRWTNDRWRSAVHRVVNTSGRERWSIAYFFDLDADANVEPLPCCVSAERPARYGRLTAGEHLAEMYRRTTVAAA